MSIAFLMQFKSQEILKALRMLQMDKFLPEDKRLVPRYNPKVYRNPKTKTQKNASSYSMFIQRWVKNNHSVLSVANEIPVPQDRKHTVTVIPKVLDSMLEDLPTLKRPSSWATAKCTKPDFILRECVNGDLLQVFAVLQNSGFYNYKWSNGDNEENIENLNLSESSSEQG